MNMEELAFRDRKTLANLNAIDLLDIIKLLQVDRKQWINQFSKTHNESIDIQKENQELKKHLKEKSHKLIELNEMVKNLEKENKKFKNQLEELRNDYKNKLIKLLANDIEPDAEDFYLAEIEGKANDYDKMKIQQKEFIKYLENEIHKADYNINILGNTLCLAWSNACKDILQTYKKMNGDDK